MSIYADIDPTAARVIGRDLGHEFDERLKAVAYLTIAILYDLSNGLTRRQISRTHKIPEVVIDDLLRRSRKDEWLAGSGITASDGSSLQSALIHRLDQMAIRRCLHCRQILRKALDPPRRGRPASYCSKTCRDGGAISVEPPLLLGYIGSCQNYLRGCTCEGGPQSPPENSLILAPTFKQKGAHQGANLAILFDTAEVGWVAAAGHDERNEALLVECEMDHLKVARLSHETFDPLAAGADADAEYIKHIAIRMLASSVSASNPLRWVIITVPNRQLAARASYFDFKTVGRQAASLRPLLEKLPVTSGAKPLVWNIRRYPPSPAHIVA